LAEKTSNISNSYYWFLAVTFLSGLIYLKTMCPGVDYIDSGELSANCLFLGIPHPTGYPMYVLLGRLFTMVMPGSAITSSHLLSLVSTSGAAGFLYLIIKRLVKPSPYASLISGSSALFAAFLPVWWNQGTSNEVYSLALLANLVIIYLVLLYYYKSREKFLFSAVYIWSLSLGFHLSTFFLLPAMAYIYIAKNGFRIPDFKKLTIMAILIVTGLSIYLYLPIRAAYQPFLNWSDPSNLQGLYNHLSGWQYQVWMFQSISIMINGIVLYAESVYENFGLIGVLPALIGLITIFRKANKLGIFLLLILLSNLFYSSNYDIADIESYYLPGFIVLAIMFGLGLSSIVSYLIKIPSGKQQRIIIKIFVFILLGCLPFFNLVHSFYNQDKSAKTFPETAVNLILQSMEQNSLAFIENWDIYSPWLYLHYIEHQRPDAVLIDKELLRRSWYLHFLKRTHPEITKNSESEINRFIELVEPFEAKGNFNPDMLTSAFQAMINSLIEQNYKSRKIYTNITHDTDIVTKKLKLPVGVLYEFADSLEYIESDPENLRFDDFKSPYAKIDDRSATVIAGFLQTLKHRHKYLEMFDKNDEIIVLNRVISSFANLLTRAKTSQFR